MKVSKLLVVDDEIVIRNFLVRVLQQAGYEVQAASNGRSALKYLHDAAFDLLLSDIKMDVMDGVALLSEAKAHDPDLAVILLTGHATVPSAIAALRQGAHNYLLKPAKNEDILAAVAAALEGRAREQRRDRLEGVAAQLAEIIGQDNPIQVPPSRSVLICGDVELDTDAYRATVNGVTLDLTPTEFRLLLEFCLSPGATFDYTTLVRAACGYTCTRHEAREIIGTHVLNLRQKMGVQADQALYVESVRGIGYRLIPPPTTNDDGFPSTQIFMAISIPAIHSFAYKEFNAHQGDC